MRDLDQHLRESLRNRAGDLDATMTAPAELATRVRQRRHRKLAVLTSTAAVIALVVGFAGLQIAGGGDAQQVTAAAPSLPEEIVAQRKDGSIAVLSTETGREVRELVPAGKVGISGSENLTVSPDGEYLYYVGAPADVEIFLTVDATDEQISEIEQLLTSDRDVAGFEYVDNDAAFEEFQRIFADDPSVVESIRPEDLPVSFRVLTTSPEVTETLNDRYTSYPAVDGVGTRPTDGDLAAVVATTAFGRPYTIARIPVAGGDAESITSGGGPLLLSPDGRRLAFTVPRPGNQIVADAALAVRDLDSGTERQLVPDGQGMSVDPLGWASDSRNLAYSLVPSVSTGTDATQTDTTILMADVVSDDGALDGEPVESSESDPFLPLTSSDGRLLGAAPGDASPETSSFFDLDLSTGATKLLATVDVAAIPLDIDGSGDNVLFAGVPGVSFVEIFGVSENGRHPDAFVGYLDAEGTVHEISSEAVAAQWIPGSDSPEGPAPPTSTTSDTDTTTEDIAESDDIQTQAATLRQVLEVDNTFGGADHRFERVFVIDHAESDAADAIGVPDSESGPAFTDEERSILQDAVADLAELEWIEAIEELDAGGPSPGSAVVTLGTVVPGDGGVEVGVGMHCGNVCGTWHTYTLAETADGWEVTGFTGSMAVS